MKKLLNKKGFTLIELIVVIAILAILAMILIPSLTGYISKATKAKDAANCRSLYTKYQLDVAVAIPVVPAVAVALPAAGTSGLTIGGTAVFAGGSVTDFTCSAGGSTYSLAGGFVASP